MFDDRARIQVQAGRGGDGSLHFRREKHVPKGGPDGGDGGPGGDVVLVADPNLRDLSAFRAKRKFKAGAGEPGRRALKHGASGETIEIRVRVADAAHSALRGDGTARRAGNARAAAQAPGRRSARRSSERGQVVVASAH